MEENLPEVGSRVSQPGACPAPVEAAWSPFPRSVFAEEGPLTLGSSLLAGLSFGLFPSCSLSRTWQGHGTNAG